MITKEGQRGLSYEKVESRGERGWDWDIKKIVSVWLMVLYGSLMSSDGQNDWQRV